MLKFHIEKKEEKKQYKSKPLANCSIYFMLQSKLICFDNANNIHTYLRTYTRQNNYENRIIFIELY